MKTCKDCIATNWVLMRRQQEHCRELRLDNACLIQNQAWGNIVTSFGITPSVIAGRRETLEVEGRTMLGAHDAR
jgi:hypothetical protein